MSKPLLNVHTIGFFELSMNSIREMTSDYRPHKKCIIWIKKTRKEKHTSALESLYVTKKRRIKCSKRINSKPKYYARRLYSMCYAVFLDLHSLLSVFYHLTLYVCNIHGLPWNVVSVDRDRWLRFIVHAIRALTWKTISIKVNFFSFFFCIFHITMRVYLHFVPIHNVKLIFRPFFSAIHKRFANKE